MAPNEGSTRRKKRLFVNCDGTGQAEFSATPRKVGNFETSPPVSNCARIGRATLTEDVDVDFEQIVYYQTGVGGDAELGTGAVAALTQGAYGVGVTSNVRTAYGFICNNYEWGDEIYITGFSRGAFTARSIAGLIGRCGILTKKGLNLFFEVLHYYRFYYDYDDKTRPPCPVSEEEGTTLQYVPGTAKTDNPVRIPIKAVGVWDTVGALDSSLKSVKWRFHDVDIGDHIENGFHIMALDEKRWFFNCTPWASKTPRDLENFEQCWMAGDHSNIGGSWDDQQLSDITLAWMMSRFEKLGVKFDQTYLYSEFLKYKDYTKTIAPYLPYDYDQNNPYKKELSPRQWGEGRLKNAWYDTPAVEKLVKCGNIASWDRTIGLYREPQWTLDANHDAVEFTGKLLKNSNETIHPVVRYRHFCKRNALLGYNEFYPYKPQQLDDNWEWPPATPNASTQMSYTFNRTINGETELVPYNESTLGKYELLYLGFYDQDKDVQVPGEEKIWKQVKGETIPDNIVSSINNIISDFKKANPSGSVTTGLKFRVGPGLYNGRRPAVVDDEAKFTKYLDYAKDIKLGSWTGDELLYANSTRSQWLDTFTNIGEAVPLNKLVKLEASFAVAEDAIRSLTSTYKDKRYESVAPNPRGGPATQPAAPTPALDLSNDKVVKVEFKARKLEGKDTSRVCGVKLTTVNGSVWKVNQDFDTIAADQNLVEEAPIKDWELAGFYGAYASGNIIRMGAVWSHQ